MMGWVGAPSVLTRLLIAVLTELMYCCSVWFWEASGAAAMTRTNGGADHRTGRGDDRWDLDIHPLARPWGPEHERRAVRCGRDPLAFLIDAEICAAAEGLDLV